MTLKRQAGFQIEVDLEDKAFEVTGAKSRRVLYTKALEYALANEENFKILFGIADKHTIKDIRERIKEGSI